ncbi:alpha/beta hydrolase [Pseudonocardia sp. GCM10023141]|uniref:alpha/beta hydrolase n=1 Tax=Pseudonocardia sp. GCM10023141 TaxID=3252653 RepID=UPI00362260D4
MPSTVVLVHGAWHGAWAWDRFLPELSDLETRTVELPSVGSDPAALGDLYADAAAVRAAVAALDGPVVVVAHSYGGAPVSEGLVGLPQVSGIVYVCAFQLDVGESLAAAVGGSAPDWWDMHEEQGYVDTLRPEEIFYGGVDAATVADAIGKLRHQGLAAFAQPQTAAAWHDIPSTYVVCEQDNAIPAVAQEAMAKRSDRVVRMDTSHSPFLTRPAELAAIIREQFSAQG